MFLSAIETLIRTIYDTPKTHFNHHTETFHTKLEKEKLKDLQTFTSEGRITNIAGSFRMCFEKGLSQISIKSNSDVSLSQNKERWPHIYERWLKGQYGNNIQAPYMEAMDLLEKKLRNEN